MKSFVVTALRSSLLLAMIAVFVLVANLLQTIGQ